MLVSYHKIISLIIKGKLELYLMALWRQRPKPQNKEKLLTKVIVDPAL